VAPYSPPALAPNSIPVSRESINGTLAATYTYDDNGSTISVTHSDQTVLRYTWDLRNKLVGLDANGDGDLKTSSKTKKGLVHVTYRDMWRVDPGRLASSHPNAGEWDAWQDSPEPFHYHETKLFP
jgi:YD repeat-containing protein